MKNILIIISFIILLTSCQKISNMDIPDSEPQLVVTYFVGPNLYSDTTYLNLDWSIPIYNNPDYYEQTNWNMRNPVEWANVSMSKNGNEFSLLYDSIIKVYRNPNSDFKAGDNVGLYVNYNKEEEIRANCVVPEKPLFDIELLDLTINAEGDSVFSIKYTSRNKGKNYFKFFMKEYGSSLRDRYYDVETGHYIDSIYRNTDVEKSYLQNPVRILNENESTVLSTEYFKGGNIAYYKDKAYRLDSVETYVLNIDEDYYKFENMPKYDWHEDGIYLLFVGEPELDFTNVEGGLGIFCAYNIDVGTINIQESVTK
ncbi:MAG: DUF4249 family protein [Bacteroidota bacterium]